MMLKSRIFRVVLIYSVCSLLGCGLSYGTPTDIACLKYIKSSLKDPNGYLTSWNFENTTEGYICKFIGIECWHPDENRVLNIRLADMGLKGNFPTGLQNCTSVTGIDLSNNELSGSVPNDISNIIKFVTTLDLSSNNFSGPIPVDLANCSYLNLLKLDHNHFSGKIPLELGLLDRLKTFSVANNHLEGPVPSFKSSFGADSYANNPGLCGKPLDDCTSPPQGSHTGVIIGA